MDHWMLICLGAIAALYASVGHGGASGYLAIMALFNYSGAWVRQDALILNLLVSGIAFWQFYRRGFFKGELLLPLVLASVPMAFVGGQVTLDARFYKVLLGCLLLIPGVLFVIPLRRPDRPVAPMPVLYAVGFGLLLGFLSGLTGIGGGVFLSPILVMGAWAGQKEAAAISAPFIFVNSGAGLAGGLMKVADIDKNILWLAAVTLVGGYIGSRMGARMLSERVLKMVLGLVLIIAAAKLIGSGLPTQ